MNHTQERIRRFHSLVATLTAMPDVTVTVFETGLLAEAANSDERTPCVKVEGLAGCGPRPMFLNSFLERMSDLGIKPAEVYAELGWSKRRGGYWAQLVVDGYACGDWELVLDDHGKYASKNGRFPEHHLTLGGLAAKPYGNLPE